MVQFLCLLCQQPMTIRQVFLRKNFINFFCTCNKIEQYYFHSINSSVPQNQVVIMIGSLISAFSFWLLLLYFKTKLQKKDKHGHVKLFIQKNCN